jgi:hypothetical protein
MGVIVWHSTVYVFGSSYGQASYRCERLKLAGEMEQWGFIEDMAKARAYFTPVIWQKGIYLCGGYQNDTIETCNGTTIRLISAKLVEPGMTICCLKHDELLILSCNYITKISGGWETTANRHQSCYFVPMTAPILSSGVIYHSDNGKIQMFSAENGQRRY